MKRMNKPLPKKIIGAPQRLKDRMEALRNRPPPTLEVVRAQWKESAEWENGHMQSAQFYRMRGDKL